MSRVPSNRPLRDALITLAAARYGWSAQELQLEGGFLVRRDGAPLPVRVSFRAICRIAARETDPQPRPEAA